MACTRESITPEQLSVVLANEAWRDDLEARVCLAILGGQRPTRVNRSPIGYGRRMGRSDMLRSYRSRRRLCTAISPSVAAVTKTLRKP